MVYHCSTLTFVPAVSNVPAPDTFCVHISHTQAESATTGGVVRAPVLNSSFEEVEVTLLPLAVFVDPLTSRVALDLLPDKGVKYTDLVLGCSDRYAVVLGVIFVVSPTGSCVTPTVLEKAASMLVKVTLRVLRITLAVSYIATY